MKKGEKQESKMDDQAVMEEYRKLATPGAPHKLLARMAGSWNTKTRSWPEPDKPPTESKGTCELKMLFDGRYLQQECSGEMMGSPFSGVGVTGYDNHTKKFVSTWMDSMSTGIYFFEGTGSADGKGFTQESHYADAVQGPMKWRAVTRLVDDNSFVFEMYGTHKKGKEEKMMEMTYTRKQ